MNVKPRALCIVNSASSGSRRLTPWLEEAGVEVVEVLGSDGLPENLSGFHGLIMLGGGLMPNEFDRAPWLREEQQLTTEAIDTDLPTLGICLGAQIIAEVAGGEVLAKHGAKERGSTQITLSDAGQSDPVLRGFGDGAPMIENHEDQITKLPENAVLLASSDAVTVQAFVIGSHVRGVQFHPEVGASALNNWDDAALRGEGYDIAELRAKADAVDGENEQASRDLVAAFAAEIRERAQAEAAANG